MRLRSDALARALALIALTVTACGDDDLGADAGTALEDGLVDGRAADAGPDEPVDAAGDATQDAAFDGAIDGARDAAQDAALDGAQDAGADMPDGGFINRCEGSCAMTDLLAAFGDASERLDVAYFGFNADATLYVEAYGGASDGCPAMDSPSPDRTLVMGSVTAPASDAPTATAATLLDFEGTLTSEPFVRASEATLIGRALSLEPVETAFVRFDLDATFDGGRVSGAVYATHCDSLDAP